MGKNYLAFDLGASSGRAILGTLEGGRLELKEIHRFQNGPVEKSGSLFWDFDAISREIKTGLKKAAAVCKDISSVAADTWGVDYVFLKNNGSLARLPYHYRDSRTDSAPAEVYKLVPVEKIYARTGIQFMQLNTLYQLHAHMRQHPGDFKDSTLLFIPDAITWLLSGKKACEYSEASTSNLLDARKRDWDFDLIDRLGLPRSVFPEIAMPCSKAGPLLESLRSELSCGPMDVVHVGSHDTASAVASVPAAKGKKWAYISCGTWALLGAELDEPFLDEEARVAGFTNEGGICGKIRFLSNIAGTWLLQETRRVWREAGRTVDFPDMAKMAHSAKPFQFLVNPNSSSFMTPGDMPARIRRYCEETGQGRLEDDAAVLRCIYDSLALCFRLKIARLEKLLGVKYDCLNIVGGGTQDKFLMELSSDVAEIPVVAGPVEATSIGNIVAQAMADGDIASLAEAREIVGRSFQMDAYSPKKTCADYAALTAKFEKLP